jgi:hypothetical protein
MSVKRITSVNLRFLLLPYLFYNLIPLYSASVELTWDCHPELDVTGYIVYWSTSDQPQDSMDVGKVERILIDGLNNDSYNFWVRAYDRSQNLGALSSPLNFLVSSNIIKLNQKAGRMPCDIIVFLNPFSRTIRITLSSHVKVPLSSLKPRIEIVDIKGRKVRSGVLSQIKDGDYIYSLNGTDKQGGKMSGGLYMVKIIINQNQIYYNKIVLYD